MSDEEYHYSSDESDREEDYSLRVENYVDMFNNIQEYTKQVLWHKDDNDHRKLASTTANPMTLAEFVNEIFHNDKTRLFEEEIIDKACTYILTVVEQFKTNGGMYDGLDAILSKCFDYANELLAKSNEKKRKREEERKKQREKKPTIDELRAARLKRFKLQLRF